MNEPYLVKSTLPLDFDVALNPFKGHSYFVYIKDKRAIGRIRYGVFKNEYSWVWLIEGGRTYGPRFGGLSPEEALLFLSKEFPQDLEWIIFNEPTLLSSKVTK